MPGVGARRRDSLLSVLSFFLVDNPPVKNSLHLSILAGVSSFEVLLQEQKVIVRGDVTPEAVVEKVAKTGKATELWK